MKYLPKIACLATTLFTLSACQSSSKKETVDNTLIFSKEDINPQANTCESLFERANGKWIKNTPIPSTEVRWGSFTTLAKNNQDKIETLIKKVSRNPKSVSEQTIGKVYKAFLDSTKIETFGTQAITAMLHIINDIGSQVDLIQAFVRLKQNGVAVPFSYYIGADDKNSTQNISNLYQSGLGLPDRDYYLSDKFGSKLEAYKEYIHDMLILLGEDADKTKGIVEDIISVETLLAKSAMSRVDRRNSDLTYNKFFVSELSKTYKNINWESVLRSYVGQKIDAVVIESPKYLQDLDTYIHDIPLFRWKAYLKWKVLNEVANWLPIAFSKRSFDFYSKTLRGAKQMKSFQERAIRTTNRLLGVLVGQLYVKEHFSESHKQNVEEMVENLRAAFKQRILGLNWMGEETKKQALHKLKSFKYKIGYPNQWDDYSNLKITSENPIEIMREIHRFDFQKMITKKLNKPVDKSEWFMSPQTVNAYYSSSFNEIVFPAAILQPPFYNPEGDVAYNYGGIGGVIGHEFSHGFDDQGSKFDANGNKNTWWTEKDRKQFEIRTKALVEQYNAYEPIKDFFVNGQLTLGENIADLAGLTMAYYALKEYYKKHPKAEKVIDGMKPFERFFYGWANAWRVKTTEGYLKNQLTTDPHSPAPYRVDGTVQNIQGFYDTFHCTKDKEPLLIW